MNRAELHRHLEDYHCIFIMLDNHATHAVYKNVKNGRKVPILLTSEILPEVVKLACDWLEIPTPVEVVNLFFPTASQ